MMRYEYTGHDFSSVPPDSKQFLNDELPMLMMYCGIGTLNKNSKDEFLNRCKDGLVKSTNWEKLEYHVDNLMTVETNVTTETRLQWLKRKDSNNIKKYNATWKKQFKM